jgi:hypothetical protein
MEDIILQEGQKVKEKKQSWREACINFALATGIELTPNALEKRYSKLVKRIERKDSIHQVPTPNFIEKRSTIW